MKNKEAHRRYNRERYADLKAHGICVECGQRDAFHGHVYCPECIEKQNESNAKYRASEKGKTTEAKYADKAKESKRAKYWERVSQGVCVDCGKALSKESARYCTEHLAYHRRYFREQNRKRRMKNTKTLDELAEQRSEVSREAVKKTHLTEGWAKWAHAPKPKMYFGKLAREV